MASLEIEDSFEPNNILGPNSSPLDSIYSTTINLIDDNIVHFKNDESEPGQRLFSGFRALKDGLVKVSALSEQLQKESSCYDFSDEIPGNGFRSFSNMTHHAVISVFEVCRQVSAGRDSILPFRKGHFVKEIEAWGQSMASLSTILEYLLTIQLPRCEDGNLVPESNSSPSELIALLDTVSQYSFYGRCLGFHFHESLHKTLKFLNISLCAFSEVYYSDGGFMQRTKQSLFTGGKYIMDPEQRSRRLVDVVQYSSIDFIKAFWSLADTELLAQLPTIVGPSLAVEQMVIVPCENMEILDADGKLMTIEAPHSHIPPTPIPCYLLSSVQREGMPGGKQLKGLPNPPSPYLIFHCHGGGFISQSTRAQQVFLREWASSLNVPIFSIDYSLAPEARYPRAFEEIFTTYVWVLNNLKLLGTTGSKIVMTGDSAGANLIMSLTTKCIQMGIRPPDGLFMAYAPFLIKVMPSASRLLAIVDPILPLGFALRCLKAYAGFPSNRTSLANTPGSPSTTMNGSVIDDLHEHPPMQFEKLPKPSDSNGDAESCAEVSHTDNADSTAVNKSSSFGSEPETDTMTTVSLTSDTTTKTGDAKEPEDPQSKEDRSKKYVTEFLEKYVLDSRVDKEGRQVPILRTGSEDVEEENVVYEVPGSGSAIGLKLSKAKDAVLDGLSAGLSSIKFLKKDKSNSPEILTPTSDEPKTEEKKPQSARKFSLGTSKLTRDSSFSLLEEFVDIEIASDIYINPLSMPDEILRKFPPCSIMSVEYDFCLDDCVTMAKKMRSLDVPVVLDVLDRLPHGFLNLCLLSKEANDGCKIAISRIRDLLGAEK